MLPMATLLAELPCQTVLLSVVCASVCHSQSALPLLQAPLLLLRW